MNYFSKNIEFLRTQKKIPATDFAKLCGIISMDEIENGKKEPSLDEIMRISEVLNYPVDRLLKEDIAGIQKILNTARIDFLALDIDGVLTDGGMFYSQNGDEYKKFNTKDGLAIKTITSKKFNVGFISSGINDHIISERARLLGVQHVYVGTWKKLEILESWCDKMKIKLENVAYIGDDVNDLAVIEKVGLSACPADAVYKIKQSAQIVLEKKGGKGCVREFIERFIMPI
jgi:3-deoxy-D-manno-octulosonate 8-phosphate phosphatase (KDO 8-P phosphatase)